MNIDLVSNIRAWLSIGCLLLMSGLSQAAGLLTPVNSQRSALQIASHDVSVTISAGFATTTVEQVFRNPHAEDLEAFYTFPLPERAAVGEFSYWIDGVEVVGEVLEQQQAKQVYEQQKQAGQEAALASQKSYQDFEIKVTPVRANGEVRLRLVYVQAVTIDSGVGRYVYPLEEGGVDEQKKSFWTHQPEVQDRFSFRLDLRDAYPVDALRLPSHPQAQIQQLDAQEWQASLTNSRQPVSTTSPSLSADDGAMATNQPAQIQQPLRLDTDIVVYWRHQPNLPGSLDVITDPPKDGKAGTFMAVFTPGDDLAAIPSGRDWVFVLDLSGSMQGKYATLIEGVRQGLNKLPVGDRFRVVLFNNRAVELTNGFQMVDATNVEQILAKLQAQKPSHGTNLYAGMEKGLKGLDSDRASALILVTDGVANVGVTQKKAFLKLLKKQDVRLFTFIMGNSANRPLLEGMTRVSQGMAQQVSNSDDIMGQIVLATSKLTHQAMRNIELDIDGIRTSDVVHSGLGSLYHGQQWIVFGHYWGDGDAEISLQGTVNGQKRVYQTQVPFAQNAGRYPELQRLWAYHTIEKMRAEQDLLGADQDREQAMRDLALEYGLVTELTSMVVVREEVFQQLGVDRRNQQRVQEERAARAERQQQATPNTRVDQQQPMFQNQRSGLSGRSGGGSLSPLVIVLLMIFLWYRRSSFGRV